MVFWALRHPGQAWNYLRAPSRLSHLLGGAVLPSQVRGWLKEANEITVEAKRRLQRASWSAGQTAGATNSLDRGPVLYAVTRALRPARAIETGVANGSSTWYILAAMKANGFGRLDSIDLPPGTDLRREYQRAERTAIAHGQVSGWLVPENLRDSWELHIGDTRTVLPNLLTSMVDLDFFFHDSEHTYEAMTFEFESIWPQLKPGGLLGSDDVGWNRSFFDFVARRRLPKVLVGGFGFTRKPTVS